MIIREESYFDINDKLNFIDNIINETVEFNTIKDRMDYNFLYEQFDSLFSSCLFSEDSCYYIIEAVDKEDLQRRVDAARKEQEAGWKGIEQDVDKGIDNIATNIQNSYTQNLEKDTEEVRQHLLNQTKQPTHHVSKNESNKTNNNSIDVSKVYQLQKESKRDNIKHGIASITLLGVGSRLLYPDEYKRDINRLKRLAERKPKSWIGKKIAVLRGLYSKWLDKAKAERDTNKAGMFKSIAATIMNCIDYLLKKLQYAVG